MQDRRRLWRFVNSGQVVCYTGSDDQAGYWWDWEQTDIYFNGVLPRHECDNHQLLDDTSATPAIMKSMDSILSVGCVMEMLHSCAVLRRTATATSRCTRKRSQYHLGTCILHYMYGTEYMDRSTRTCGSTCMARSTYMARSTCGESHVWHGGVHGVAAVHRAVPQSTSKRKSGQTPESSSVDEWLDRLRPFAGHEEHGHDPGMIPRSASARRRGRATTPTMWPMVIPCMGSGHMDGYSDEWWIEEDYQIWIPNQDMVNEWCLRAWAGTCWVRPRVSSRCPLSTGAARARAGARARRPRRLCQGVPEMTCKGKRCRTDADCGPSTISGQVVCYTGSDDQAGYYWDPN